MKYREERNRIVIEPTNDVEIAYIEEVFGLKRDGDEMRLVRKNAMGLGCIAYLETKRDPQVKDRVEIWKPQTLEEFIANSTEISDWVKQLTHVIQGLAANPPALYEGEGVVEEYTLRLEDAIKSRNFVVATKYAILLANLTED